MHVRGRCHCGQIAYEADVDPEDVSICHCTDCQMLTGSAYRVSVRTSQESFRLLSGQPTSYTKTADSGARRAHSFCPNCGAPTYARAAENPTSYSLRVGCLEERASLPPRIQIWCQSAVPWSGDLGAILQIGRQ